MKYNKVFDLESECKQFIKDNTEKLLENTKKVKTTGARWLKDYGINIKAMRKALGLTQLEVAKGIFRSTSYLSHIENGERFSSEDDNRLNRFYRNQLSKIPPGFYVGFIMDYFEWIEKLKSRG